MGSYYKIDAYFKLNGMTIHGCRQHQAFSVDIGGMYTLLPFSVANWYGNRDRWKGDKKIVRLD